ncbi:hypothetical protein Tco_1085090 [Tanacetum coccineum]
MGSHTLQQLRGYTFDEIQTLFETTMRRVNTFVPMETEVDRAVPELVVGSSQAGVDETTEARSSQGIKTGGTKRAVEEELDQQSYKKQKADELSQEELQQLMIIVPEEGMNVEALQTKYLIIDWEVYTEESRNKDLEMLWSLVQERFNSTEPTEDKERELWVELKRLFDPDADDELQKWNRYLHADREGVSFVKRQKDQEDEVFERILSEQKLKNRSRIGINNWYQSQVLKLGSRRNKQEELFTHKEEMDLETRQTTTTAKRPLLKQGEYDIWRLRIDQYFQAQKENDVKARSMLLMALPNEHQLTFNQYKDAKTLFATITTRFGGNDATKKTQKTLLKQMYENFSAPSTKSLESIFNRLQKIVSPLAILGEHISQEDLNLKFLRCLPSEWNTHVVVWRNKPDLETMSFDDLYNNFKINMAFVSAPGSTNEVNTAYGVSTASPQVHTASIQVSTANLSDATVYAFLADQPNGSHLIHKDLKQIHEDNLEEMDLKWQLALLSMRARRGPRNQDGRYRNQDNSRKIIKVEDTSSKAMVAIDGVGFD